MTVADLMWENEKEEIYVRAYCRAVSTNLLGGWSLDEYLQNFRLSHEGIHINVMELSASLMVLPGFPWLEVKPDPS